MAKSADRTLVQKTSLSASKKSLSHRWSLAVPWLLYQNIYPYRAARGRHGVVQEKVHEPHRETLSGEVWQAKFIQELGGASRATVHGQGLEIQKKCGQKPSTGLKEEIHRIPVTSNENHSEHFSCLSFPPATWRRWFAPPAGLGPLSRNCSGNCFVEHDTWLAILCWNGGSRKEKGF